VTAKGMCADTLGAYPNAVSNSKGSTHMPLLHTSTCQAGAVLNTKQWLGLREGGEGD
jgi:hypothetical protein